MSKNLLVENNEMFREMISRWLVLWSYEVILAVDGEDGINAEARIMPALLARIIHFNKRLPIRLRS